MTQTFQLPKFLLARLIVVIFYPKDGEEAGNY